MTAKHTPGPWRIKMTITGPEKSKMEVSAIIGTQAKDAIIKVLDADFDDARLIAAAPTLLEVLQELEESSGYWSEYDVPLGIVERIKAAIALATGTTA